MVLWQATWLSRLHDAQENYREACRKLDVKRLSTAECAAATAAGVDINVLQCDENISLVESTTDVAASPQQVRLMSFETKCTVNLMGIGGLLISLS